MTQEEKNLLLQDLCGRLPYGVKVNHLLDTKPSDLFAIDTYRSTLYCFRNGREEWYKVEFIQPYLRPMSSMTDEEREEYIGYAGYEIEETVNGRHYEYYLKDFCGTPNNPSVNADSVDWLNKNMFDYRGLIPKGLANEAPEGMYNNLN